MEHYQLERCCFYAELRREIPESQQQVAGLRQRGRTAVLPAPPNGHSLRRLDRHPLGYRHRAQISDNRRDLLCPYHSLVRATD